jgi:GNAT superfamily N-acetyltransferase
MQHQLSVSLETNPDAKEVAAVEQSLARFNTTHVGPDHYLPLNMFARNHDGEVFAALLGETYWNWLHVRILWIHESHRKMGLGRRLLREAEDEARRRGCQNANLDTHDFQAEEFYLKNGYEVFGVLDDLPVGHRRIYMKKKLRGGTVISSHREPGEEGRTSH